MLYCQDGYQLTYEFQIRQKVTRVRYSYVNVHMCLVLKDPSQLFNYNFENFPLRLTKPHSSVNILYVLNPSLLCLNKKQFKKQAISFLQFICNCLHEARFSHLCLFKPSNQQGFFADKCQNLSITYKSMSVLLLKKEFKLVKCHDICQELTVFFDMFFFAKS